MQRCVLSKLLALSSLLCALAVQAQAVGETDRKFPATALRGVMAFGAPPQVMLNGKSTQLAPGSRIRNASNMQQLSGELVGTQAVVHYTTDLLGQPLQVWVLTAAERAKQPWPTTSVQAQAWRFNADTQTWTQQ